MKIYDLDISKRDENQNKLYDLIEPTFKSNIKIPLSTYIVPPEEEMRIDLICNSIYNNPDYCDFILNLNDIDNPLNILSGDTILFVDVSAISSYRINTGGDKDNRKQLLNTNKISKKDSNRKKYIDENYSLPPTYSQTLNNPVQIESGQISIGK